MPSQWPDERLIIRADRRHLAQAGF